MNDLPVKMQFNDTFFEEEVRCGFTVTSERKEVWAVEMDLLQQLDKMCKKLNLHYCAGAGTLLGAVRHNGYIPWDDDVDVYMLREEYNVLMDHAKEFEDPYFLQIPQTEPLLVRSFAKLRNKRTYGANYLEERDDICKGLFIDIFPLDGISPDHFKNKCQGILNACYKKLFSWYAYKVRKDKGMYSVIQKIKHLPVSILMFPIRNNVRLYQAYEHNVSKYSQPNIVMWGNRTIHFECPRSRRPLEEWKDLINVPFETITIPIPRSYDKMLRQQYGDYMQIPKDKSGNLHGELLIDTRHSYEELRRTTL